MSEQPARTGRSLNLNQVRARLSHLRTVGRHSMFGVAEIVGLAVSVVILVAVVVSYLYFLVPARSRLDSVLSERSLLQSRLRSEKDAVLQNQSTETTVQKITESLDSFEGDHLVGRNQGRMELYDALNQLITKDGLRNTSGPTYATLVPAGSKTGASTTKSTNTKWQSIYPGISVNLTVEGQYQNLRRFVRDIEASKQFIIINAVELERSTETSGSPSAEANPGTGGRGSLVSLRLDMATYFSRGSETGDALESVKH
jgi:Tfp pilus assembly protein PilO